MAPPLIKHLLLLVYVLLVFEFRLVENAPINGYAKLQNSNSTMLFISGWPQSGTSLLNQIVSLSPYLSTMVKKCNEIHGKPCKNWNHEGQVQYIAMLHGITTGTLVYSNTVIIFPL